MQNVKIYYSIIIPAYNEQNTIKEIINRVKNTKYPKKYEIIVIDDASVDRTAKILNGIKEVTVIRNSQNQGKGYSLRKGFEKAKGEIILIQDADLEYDPKDHLKLINELKKPQVNVVYGSRFLKRRPIARYKLFYWGNIFLSQLTRILYGANVTDMETCYKAFKKKALNSINLTQDRFGIEPEITCKFLKKQFRITEIPITYRSRSYKEGKKIGLKDGFYAIFLLFKYKFYREKTFT